MSKYITLTGHQLKQALEFVNPDGESDADQLDCEIGIYEQEGKQYVFMIDYPEDGGMELTNE